MKDAETPQRTTCFIKKLLTDSHSTGWHKRGATRLFHSNWSFAALRLCFIKDDVVSHQEINKYSSRSTQRLFCTLVEESVFNWLVR